MNLQVSRREATTKPETEPPNTTWIENEGPNGRERSPSEEQSPRLRQCSGSTTPTRTPSPARDPSVCSDEKTIVKSKSVSFHSHTNWKNDRKIHNARDCLEYMMEGSSLIKLRSNGRQYHRYFCLLGDLSAVRWSPSSKKSSRAQVPIEDIKEIRTGRNCESLRHKSIPAGYNEERIFSILYGCAYESLDLVAQSPEEANIWVTGLNALIGASKSPDDSNEDTETLRETWLRDNFVKASQDSRGSIDQATCIQLIQRLDNQVAIERVKQKLQEIDLNKTDGFRGRVEIEEFIDIFKEIATRPEIYFLMIRYANKDYLSVEDFHLFLEGEQGTAGLTEEKVMEMILRYEPSPEARKLGQLLVDGFTKYLLSEECDIFDPVQRDVCQEMDHPLSHYFISTSHNTYLLEDQLKGPSSVDGYIRVLSCGCRCVKVDVWDGTDEPVVYHGNTLTTKVLFRDVIDVIASCAFDYSVYPVFIHLENHCCVRQQRLMAEILKSLLGKSLYVHPKNSKIRFCDLSPERLKFKIILKGKKIPDGQLEWEVSDEDEGGETRRTTDCKKIRMCRELSSLFSLGRNKFIDFQNMNSLKNSDSEMWSLSESTTAKLSHCRSEELVHHNKTFLTRVYPNSSRVDSSNFNPQDFWNSGCQMVALNFQTPGQMMDVYEGRFRGNGACGYALKPAVMREHISVFSANSRETIPGVAPQILKIKVISGQCLPKPRGSTAIKASVIDPYVVIQVFGIPADCSEAKTRTVSNDGNSPVFDESFDFLINLPELALVRFVVIDDDYIGDDFIGQCSIPFDCLQTGYRHMRLLSSMGEPLDNATLFVHVSVSSKRGGKSHSSWGRKSQRLKVQIKGIGFRQADDVFKDIVPSLSEAEQKQQSVEGAWSDLQEECGLGHTANMKQCLKVVVKRLLSQPGNQTLSIVKENGISFLRTSNSGTLPSHLHKLEAGLEKLLLEIHHFQKECPNIKSNLENLLKPALSLYDDLEQCLSSHGIKGKKANRARENFSYNVRVIRGQLDRLHALEKNGRIAMEQVESTKSTLGSIRSRDKSPSLRERPRLNLANKPHTAESLASYGSLGRSPTSPLTNDNKPKSILKKSNSNIESRSMGYAHDVQDVQDDSQPHLLLKPPLHHSLSYTPGFNLDSKATDSYDTTGYNNLTSDFEPMSRSYSDSYDHVPCEVASGTYNPVPCEVAPGPYNPVPCEVVSGTYNPKSTILYNVAPSYSSGYDPPTSSYGSSPYSYSSLSKDQLESSDSAHDSFDPSTAL